MPDRTKDRKYQRARKDSQECEERERKKAIKQEKEKERKSDDDSQPYYPDGTEFVKGGHYGKVREAMNLLKDYKTKLSTASSLEGVPALDDLTEASSFRKVKQPFKSALEAIVKNMSEVYSKLDKPAIPILHNYITEAVKELQPIVDMYSNANDGKNVPVSYGNDNLNAKVKEYINKLPGIMVRAKSTPTETDEPDSPQTDYRGWYWIFDRGDSRDVFLCGEGLEDMQGILNQNGFIDTQYNYTDIDDVLVDFVWGMTVNYDCFGDPKKIFKDFERKQEGLSRELVGIDCLSERDIHRFEPIAQKYLERNK